MEGSLEKKSDILTIWRSRYFRFDEEDKMLMWFPSKESSSSNGMATVTKVFQVPDRPSKRVHRLDILTEKGGTKYWVQVAAPNRRVMEKWTKSLSSVATVTDDISAHPRCAIFKKQMGPAGESKSKPSIKETKRSNAPAPREEEPNDQGEGESEEEQEDDEDQEDEEQAAEDAAMHAASSAAAVAACAGEAALSVKQKLKKVRKTIKKLQQKQTPKKSKTRRGHARQESKYGDIHIDPRGMITVVLNKTTGLGLVLADNDSPDAQPPRYETAVAGFAPVDGSSGPAELSGTIKPGHILARVNSEWMVGKPHSEVLQAIRDSAAQIELGFTKEHKHARHLSHGAPLQIGDGPRCVVLTTTTKHERRMEANERKMLALLSAKMVLYTVEYVDLDSDTTLPDRELANLPQAQIFGMDQVNLYTYEQLQELEDNDQLDTVLDDVPQVDEIFSHPALS
jgi:hypothetical protein